MSTGQPSLYATWLSAPESSRLRVGETGSAWTAGSVAFSSAGAGDSRRCRRRSANRLGWRARSFA
jgi:hypothetical protein